MFSGKPGANGYVMVMSEEMALCRAAWIAFPVVVAPTFLFLRN